MGLERAIDALVVGAGPVGLTAALALVRNGQRRIEIIDEAERRTGLSYALALHPATLEVLERLGVGAAVLERGNRVERIALYDGGLRRVELDLGRLDRQHRCVLVLPQAELEAVLLAALAAEGVEVRWRHRLGHLDERGGPTVGCVIERIDSDSSGYAVAKVGGVVGKRFEREAALVIGADGHGSLVRRQLGIELEATAPPGVVAVFELEGHPLPADHLEEEARREMRITFADGLRSVWWPLPDGRTRLGFELPADDETTAPRDKSRLPPIVPWLAGPLEEARLHELVATRLPWHEVPRGRLMWAATVRFARAVAGAFGRGRVWLAGDAAHLAFPFGVTSMNAGIAEAEQLANRGAGVLAGSAPLAVLAEDGAARLAGWRERLASGPGAAVEEAAAPGRDPWVEARVDAIAEVLPVAEGEARRLLGC